MGRHRLAGIDAKLARAEYQLEDLGRKWGVFLNEEQPYTVEFKHDPNAGIYLPTFWIDKEPPLELSVLCGELVYDLRSALDHIAVELIEVHGAKPIRRAAFPISSTEVDWIERVHFPRNAAGKRVRGPLHGLSKLCDAWAYVQRAQPYQRGSAAPSHPLAELNELSNRDKHRVIHAVWAYPDLSVIDMFTWDLRAHFRTAVPKLAPGAPLEHGAELAWFVFDPDGPDPKMRVKRQIPFSIAFGDPEGDRVRGGGLADLLAFVKRVRRDCVIWIG